MIVRQFYVYAFRIGLIRSFLPFRVVSLFCVTHLHALFGEKKKSLENLTDLVRPSGLFLLQLVSDGQ